MRVSNPNARLVIIVLVLVLTLASDGDGGGDITARALALVPAVTFLLLELLYHHVDLGEKRRLGNFVRSEKRFVHSDVGCGGRKKK